MTLSGDEKLMEAECAEIWEKMRPLGGAFWHELPDRARTLAMACYRAGKADSPPGIEALAPSQPALEPVAWSGILNDTGQRDFVLAADKHKLNDVGAMLPLYSQAQVTRITEERDEFWKEAIRLKSRAEAAETRLAEVEGALKVWGDAFRSEYVDMPEPDPKKLSSERRQVRRCVDGWLGGMRTSEDAMQEIAKHLGVGIATSAPAP
jgi:hypothetical protein